MSETHASTENHHEPGLYEIRIKGHLHQRWANWFEGLTITLEEDGDTLLTGPVADQAALHGLLRKTRDLGLLLISVNRVEPGPSKKISNIIKKECKMHNMNMKTHKGNMTLVLGGTGKTGRRVAERLTARGLSVRIGSRSGEPPFDWEDQATWAPILDGVGAVYVSYYPDLVVPGAVEAVGSFAELAVANGVRRLVLLAGRGEPEAEQAEQAVRNSGANLTILRATWFSQNFSEGFMLEPVLSGEIALPAGNTPEPFIDVDDIADVAVAALTEDGHVGQIYELTGPRLLTFAQVAEEIAQATGREIRYVPVSIEQYTAAAAEQGLPGEVIDLLRYLFSVVLDGRNAHLANGVQRALGREPRDFSDYARATAATGIWGG
jgi:uncharacterized protein YbjT (DUF2867 family)